ncbi:unnamed protein product [Paramecium sonneborni]|uniref:Uncharacterized protein n=1 Tax=Paramecium sonneborni TaxID=65129 RepID=A0A8S1QYA6_9CILI|nr:unnamed protein product [Paramecium sonneborni]
MKKIQEEKIYYLVASTTLLTSLIEDDIILGYECILGQLENSKLTQS